MTILAEPNVKIDVGTPDIGGRELVYVMDAVKSGWVTMGRWVDRFERLFAETVGTKHAIACSSGTAALHLALAGLGINWTHEVIVPTMTFIATVNAVRYVHACPVFVDSESKTWAMDPAAIERSITPRTKAVLLAHLYGVPGQIGKVRDICKKRGLYLIEDAAEALGAVAGKTQQAGAVGDVGCFSFYGNKTITTGEGGMVVTNDDALAERVRLLRGQGQQPGRRYWHVVTGYNYRMTDIQAALGMAQLERLGDLLERRRAVIQAYRTHLRGVGLHAGELPLERHGAWAVAVVLPDGVERERVMRDLARMGIETRPVFPMIHTMPMYELGDRFPVAEELSTRGLVLPCHSRLSVEDVQYIAYQLRIAVYGADLPY